MVGLSLRRLERKLVWIMGSPRTGSTWLMNLLHEERAAAIHEPLIGAHLGLLSAAAFGVPWDSVTDRPRAIDLRKDEEYFFSEQYLREWQPALRALLLRRFASQLPRSSSYCLIHEPNGSEGADIIMGALPTSFLIFLLRDGRDVVDSMIDARQKGSWVDEAFGAGDDVTGARRLELIKEEAHRWVVRTNAVRRAYESHRPSRRLIVRYEDLRTDTSAQLRMIYDGLGFEHPLDLDERVERGRFEAVPAEHRGSGRFHRAATPGLWRQNLTGEEQTECRRIMGPTLGAMGYRD